MTDGPLATSEADDIVVQLLDPTQGTPLKTWKFQGKSSISIGRTEDRDVEVVDPYVSRSHALLEARDGVWVLVSQGRNGVFVNSRPITEHVISGDLTFRLGTGGPVLAFKTGAQRSEHTATLSFDSMPLALLAVDEHKLQQEVDTIAGKDDFQRLQEQARALRRKRTESSGGADSSGA
jgi:pSer/pThr/pTyr-binding forkhead associated (FHA) protein